MLPGVTVTALLEATGNTFVAVSDERGFYRVPVRVGTLHVNWTIATQEQSPQDLKRTAGENRTMQFGFRVTF